MKILLGVTGSVAAKLTPKLVRAIKDADPHVELRIVTTTPALYFFERGKVNAQFFMDIDEWPGGHYEKGQEIPHIALAQWANKFLIAPLTANTLCEIANGGATKLITSTVLAWPRRKPMLIAPAMNTQMWENPLTQRNVQTVIETYSATLIEPQNGKLACGIEGIGAMANIDDIVATLFKTD